jgi:hypothetical protein
VRVPTNFTLQPASADDVLTLLARKAELGLPNLSIEPLPDFLAAARAQSLPAQDLETICDQATLILDQFYAHLPFKKARYGIDPVQRLRLLRTRIPELAGSHNDLEFHTELIRIFTELRDAHTLYGLPPPYRGSLAFLPFVLKHYTDPEGRLHFVVTQTLVGFEHPDFRPGVEITGWNGMPIERAVREMADLIPAGNQASKFTRGLSRMTARNLTYTPPPAEDYVFLQYITTRNAEEQQQQVVIFPWNVASGFPEGSFRAPATAICHPLAERAMIQSAIWEQTPWDEQQAVQRTDEAGLTARQGMGEAPIFSSLADVPESLRTRDLAFLYSQLPEVFEFQHPSGLILRRTITPDELYLDGEEDKRFGYIRIKTFEAHPDAIFREFKRILEVMTEFAPDGLILDVRGNPGGSIKGAEQLLQLLCPREIAPASFHFANTPSIQKILSGIRSLSSADRTENRIIRGLQAELAPWIEDAANALAEGLQLTEGRPLTSVKSANDTGQVYHGPVALLIDAVSYSATDLFAAGFQDHDIGLIIGVDENTGGGGASRWWHEDDLLKRLDVVPDLPVRPLPGGSTIAFAYLRSTRTGRHAGEALEDIGVTRDIAYSLTKKDLMDWGSDLVRFACRQLATRTSYRLQITGAELTPTAIRLHLQTRNLERLACFVNGIPQHACSSAAANPMEVPLDGLDPADVRRVEVRGYAKSPQMDLQLAASVRWTVPPRNAAS